MALTLNGSTRWPSAKELQRLGETRVGATPSQIRAILESIREAIRSTSLELHGYIKDHPDFEVVGKRMLQEWEKGTTLLHHRA
jgi:serine/threonine-protein kinase HipA